MTQQKCYSCERDRDQGEMFDEKTRGQKPGETATLIELHGKPNHSCFPWLRMIYIFVVVFCAEHSHGMTQINVYIYYGMVLPSVEHV